MPQVPIIMPQLGESIAEATVVTLKVSRGKVVADQEIIEVETNKAVMSVTTPCAGEIASIAAVPKETYAVGTVLGYIEASEADAAKFTKTAPEQPTEKMASEVRDRQEERVKAGPAKHEQWRPKRLRSGACPFRRRLKARASSPGVRARMAELQPNPGRFGWHSRQRKRDASRSKIWKHFRQSLEKANR